MSGGIYPNPPKYENTDDFISQITNSAPRNKPDNSALRGDDFDRQKLYGTTPSGSSHKHYKQEDNSCGTCCVKFFMFILNIIFMAAGVGVVIVGILVFTKKDTHIMGKTLPIGVILVGVFLILFAIYGCIAAKVQNKCLLFLYFILLFCLMLIFLAMGIAIAVISAKPSILRKGVEEGWKQESKISPTSSAGKHGFDQCDLQADWKCSGFDQDDCKSLEEAEKNHSETCPICKGTDKTYYFDVNCWTRLIKFIKTNMMILVIGDGTAFAVVLFSMIFTCCLCKRRPDVLSSEKLLYKRINEL